MPLGEREATAVQDDRGDSASIPGAYVGYLDDHAYPEGRRVLDARYGSGVGPYRDGGGAAYDLTLFSGPSDAECTVILSGAHQTVKMIPGQTSTVSFDVPNQRVVPLTVGASAFFRPSEADAASTDSRGLGCQVRVGLE